MKINISKFFVSFFLFLSKSFPEDKFLVVCKGYGDDYELFTGLHIGRKIRTWILSTMNNILTFNFGLINKQTP